MVCERLLCEACGAVVGALSPAPLPVRGAVVVGAGVAVVGVGLEEVAVAVAGVWDNTTAASAVAATPPAAVQPVARATRRSPRSRATTRGSGSEEGMGPVDRRFLGASWELDVRA
ncbi:hypothetical protein SAMN05216377_101256 [Pseudonocardia oroxyli]|uniref:Uncharacterized protein n=1 Tax=Pseudonocardia oroxyli TaxID=366584 RepID=A0A1G7E501_PSEOR|nr:hypothetical protein SAMN05216377_101256 [Pseudonocardia oroxyli]